MFSIVQPSQNFTFDIHRLYIFNFYIFVKTNSMETRQLILIFCTPLIAHESLFAHGHCFTASLSIMSDLVQPSYPDTKHTKWKERKSNIGSRINCKPQFLRFTHLKPYTDFFHPTALDIFLMFRIKNDREQARVGLFFASST